MIEFDELRINNGEPFQKEKWNGLLDWVAENPLNLTPQTLTLTNPEGNSTLQIEAKNSHNVIQSSANKPVVINPNASNVGIGTNSPTAKLEIAGGGGTSIDLKVNGRIRSNNNSGGLWVASDRFVGGHSTNKIGFYNNGKWRLTIQNNGHVGINTNSPRTTLEVNGTLMAASYLYSPNSTSKLIEFKTFSNLGNNVDKNTGFNTSDWNAAIVGFKSGSADIQENDSGTLFNMYMSRRGSRWHIIADFRTHRRHENWTVFVMFVRKEISRRA